LITKYFLTLIFCIGVYSAICSDVLYHDPFSAFNPYTPEEVDSLRSYGEYNYCNHFSRESDNDSQGYSRFQKLKLNSHLNLKRHTLVTSFQYFAYEVNADQLSDKTDWVDYEHSYQEFILTDYLENKDNRYRFQLAFAEHPGGALGYRRNTGKGYWDINTGIKQSASGISYNVQDNSGKIPFRWLSSYSDFKYVTPKDILSLKVGLISPQKTGGDFENRFWSSTLSTSYSRRISRRINAGIQGDYSTTGADWRYHDEQYGKLDHIQIFHASGWISYESGSPLSLTGGSKWLVTRCGDDSYLDIWPFSFMDVFLDSRTRLKKADLDVFRPFLSLSWSMSFEKGNFNGKVKLTAEYDHFIQKQEIIVKQRYYIMFPFFLGYKTNEYDFSDETDGYFVIPVSAGLGWKQWKLNLHLQQLIPVKWKDIDFHESSSSQPDRNKTSESGGTELRIILSARF
jgi:hypothetical protein